MNRRKELGRTKPLTARTALKTGTGLKPEKPLAQAVSLHRTARLAPVSAKRSAQNRERRAMVRRLWPDGQPPCGRPGCTRLADDLHEPLTRARGGSITDEENAKPLCRPCHDEITFSPESELGWAYDCELLRHSWPSATMQTEPSEAVV